MLTSYPDVLIATVAVLLLVAVGVVSARAARRRLSYETWPCIHLCTYLAVALAFAHQFATGADFTDPKARVLWAALYIIVAATLLWFRLVTPVRRAVRHRFRVLDVRPESPDVVSVYLVGDHLDALARSPVSSSGGGS